MDSKMIKTLCQIAQKLNSLNIVWGVGASVMLHHYGLYDDPNDIDIFVALKDAAKAKKVFDALGKPLPIKQNKFYTSDYFYKYEINNISIDIIAGYQINHTDGAYRYHFDENSVGDREEIDGVLIPYCLPEDWYAMYLIMPNGKKKAELIAGYLDKINNK